MLKSVTKKLKPFIEAKLNEEYVCIANDSNLYCLDYIEERLKRCNIESDLEFIRPKDVSENTVSISAKIIEVGELLETSYPHLYNNVSKQLKVKLRSEVIVGDIFRNFGRELFREGVTWGRIIALFAFAAAISADCITQGRPELVKTVLSCVRLYVLDHLAVWIRSQGGWVCNLQLFVSKNNYLNCSPYFFASLKRRHLFPCKLNEYILKNQSFLCNSKYYAY